jgi:hypothetical protein
MYGILTDNWATLAGEKSIERIRQAAAESRQDVEDKDDYLDGVPDRGAMDDE